MTKQCNKRQVRLGTFKFDQAITITKILAERGFDKKKNRENFIITEENQILKPTSWLLLPIFPDINANCKYTSHFSPLTYSDGQTPITSSTVEMLGVHSPHIIISIFVVLRKIEKIEN